jgi:Zn-dependent peptidase ImmA (M78 family)/DNA-binding XRE family transcriptional regulator
MTTNKLNSPLNPDMIALARQLREFTQEELANKTNVTQGMISMAEQGMKEISDDLLSKLSNALNLPENFFFQEGGIVEPGMRYYRKRSTVKKQHLNRIDAEFNIVLRNIKKLLSSVEFIDLQVPFLDLEEYENDPAMIAKVLREYWEIPKGPIKNLTEIIEAAGIIIIPWDFGTKKLDGFSFTVFNLPPVIFINDSLKGDRQRFTLAHELGHIILHSNKPPTKDLEEDEANTFASEFMMPDRDIKSMLFDLDLKKLSSLKLRWKMSIAAIIMRAASLNVITYNQKRYLFQKLSKLGWRKSEPQDLDIPSEQPSLLKELIDVHLKNIGYTPEALCQMLKISPQDFNSWYIKRNPRLKLVK